MGGSMVFEIPILITKENFSKFNGGNGRYYSGFKFYRRLVKITYIKELENKDFIRFLETLRVIGE
jgi:hypothetical protein